MLKLLSRYAKILAVLWSVFITILFLLPGSALPKGKFLDNLYFDKWIHLGFFGLLLFLWRSFFKNRLHINTWLLLLAVCYGLGVEIVQHFFVANRSFDLGDLLADITGAAIGLWIWQGVYKKNRPL